MGRVLDTLTTYPKEQRHPALMNTMYLWACFISRPEPLSQHEDHYLGLALDALQEGLRDGEKIIDIIQGSCLLSMYFLVNGRILEGSYHATAAAALAVQCGLHINTYQDEVWFSNSHEQYDMKPPRTGVKEGERILAFWQVYNLDRCWSVILRKPCIIPDGPDPRQSISCPWPQDWAEYEAVGLKTVVASRSVDISSRRAISTSFRLSRLSEDFWVVRCFLPDFRHRPCVSSPPLSSLGLTSFRVLGNHVCLHFFDYDLFHTRDVQESRDHRCYCKKLKSLREL